MVKKTLPIGVYPSKPQPYNPQATCRKAIQWQSIVKYQSNANITDASLTVKGLR